MSSLVDSATPTSVVVRAPATSNFTNATVSIIADTGASQSVNDSWSSVAPGVILSVVPPRGIPTTRVTIMGVGLRADSGSVARVWLAGAPANLVFENDTHVVVTAGAGLM